MLVVALIITGLGTFLVGRLATYEHIGIAAPILLVFLRLLQGIGIGGELDGAVLMVVENAPPRVIYCSVEFSNGMFAMLRRADSDEALAIRERQAASR